MHFLNDHRLFFGLAADAVTLIGALTLAKEAFGRLRDLTGNRISEDFNKRFPGLPLIDQEKAAAARIVRYAFFGCTLMIFGFLLQSLTRIAEVRSEHPPHAVSSPSEAANPPGGISANPL
jgi:hypothetical protein